MAITYRGNANVARPNLTYDTQRTATTPGTSRPTIFEECVGSLTSHIGVLNMEDIVRRDLRSIVLIRENLKV